MFRCFRLVARRKERKTTVIKVSKAVRIRDKERETLAVKIMKTQSERDMDVHA
jgi:hypothetical protein